LQKATMLGLGEGYASSRQPFTVTKQAEEFDNIGVTLRTFNITYLPKLLRATDAHNKLLHSFSKTLF
jgi:hypothetical protein